jgi:Domain of unknown function (DUF4124)
MLFRALLHISVLLALAVPAFGQVYKWVDEKGVTHYGEAPPQGKPATEISNKVVPGSAGARPAEDLGEKDREFRQRKIQADAAQEKQQQEAVRRQELCNQQRDLLARLKQSGRTYTLNEKGERVYMDDAERDASIARQEKFVAEQCKS